MSHTHTKKTIPAPGLEAMLSALGTSEVGHPGDGWFSARELAETAGLDHGNTRTRCNKLVHSGVYESCQRKIGRNYITFYRMKSSASVQQRQNHERPVRSSPTARILPSRGKRAGKR